MSEISEKVPSQMGGKKSNGHKDSCTCPICQNMMMKKGKKNMSSSSSKFKSSKGKKSNGHKLDCMCPICKNMMMKKGGSNVEAYEPSVFQSQPKTVGGKKKSNGHKLNCGCPICKNMKKGGSEDDVINTNDELENETTTTSSLETTSGELSEGSTSTPSVTMGGTTSKVLRGGKRRTKKTKKSKKTKKTRKSRSSRRRG